MLKRNDKCLELARHLKMISLGPAPTTADYQSAQERLVQLRGELGAWAGQKGPEADAETARLLTAIAVLESVIGIK
jgi:hypothetical protein